ncbi:hypothetical protein LMJ53_14420 [Rheinheimera sp. UJ51]|uniref:hypothetical protein n=1 Tax=Rheinheimera sp. UJ51 TaxID=2892446 RepID=UPI001E41E81C|nr:hypothetical protein [Rheinheimera sp. UJ51]MCC5452919.1 hypothetical protein [Rheinheimera sp. UJ51]
MTFQKTNNNITHQFDLFEQECMGVLVDESFSVHNIIECNTSISVKNFDPDKFNQSRIFNRAVKTICNRSGLHEYEVECILKGLQVFHSNNKNLSFEDFIEQWDAFNCFAEVNSYATA